MSSSAARSLASANPKSSTQRYLTFRLADEIYGVSVLGVQEILRLPTLTRVPQLPAHVRGVLNLRGRIIPVIDMRQRFGLAAGTDTSRTCVIVVRVESARRGTLHMGLVVDGVEEVSQIAETDIAATPEFGCTVNTAFLLGMAKVRESVISLLDLDRVLTSEQFDDAALAVTAS